jgi:hypothetical protein
MTEQNRTGIDKRRYPRLRARILYKQAKLIGQKRQVPDISLGGMRIFSFKFHPVGATMHIELSLPSGQTAVAVTRVVWVEAYPKDSEAPYDLGLEFIHMPFGVAHELKSVLDSPFSQS